jgi:UDP-N-acetylmuramyl pentapeptide phosphotransferase/UDP-N-acetylglucosamine-1-phosphate transferase
MTPAVFVAPAVLTACLSFALTRLAIRVGAVDRPGPHKIHSTTVPRLGGLA